MSEQGILSFALGLEAGGFLSSCAEAGGGLKRFAAEIVSVGAAAEMARVGFEHMFSAVEQGAHLQDLASRSREAVGTIYELEEGLKGVGVDSEAAGTMILKMQRSLTGVTETGENAMLIFERLGLHVADLRKMDAAGQMTAVAEALSKIDKNQAGGYAQALFGREGSANILQIAGSVKQFKESISGSAANAFIWDRASAQFREMSRTMDELKSGFSTMWAEAAFKAAPFLERMLDFGKRFTDAFVSAIENGRIMEVLAMTITTGFKVAADVLPTILKSGSEMMAQGMVDSFVEGRMQAHINKLQGQLKDGNMPHGQDAYSIQQEIAREQDILDNYRKMPDDQSAENFKAKLTDALKNAQADLTAYFVNLSGVSSLAKTFKGSGGGSGPSSPDDDIERYRPQFTSLEKMGFVMTGLNNPLNSPQQETARNTHQIVVELRAMRNLWNTFKPSVSAAWSILNSPL